MWIRVLAPVCLPAGRELAGVQGIVVVPVQAVEGHPYFGIRMRRYPLDFGSIVI